MKQPLRNFRHEIPARAFINAQIIQEARSTSGFENAIKKVLSMDIYKSQGLVEYQFENSAYVASLLYCLIVIPKEIWASTENSSIYDNIAKYNPLSFFKIGKESEKDRNKPIYRLIHRLRNAVSHANFSIDNDMNFMFWDMPPGKAETEWEGIIDANSLMKFLSLVGSALANEGLTSVFTPMP